jgi:hypothetical protein
MRTASPCCPGLRSQSSDSLRLVILHAWGPDPEAGRLMPCTWVTGQAQQVTTAQPNAPAHHPWSVAHCMVQQPDRLLLPLTSITPSVRGPAPTAGAAVWQAAVGAAAGADAAAGAAPAAAGSTVASTSQSSAAGCSGLTSSWGHLVGLGWAVAMISSLCS